MKITIKVLAQDIKEADYFNVKDCPIARAVKRLGYKEVFVGGHDIDIQDVSFIPLPYEADDKLLDMRSGEIPTEDFEFELEVPDTLKPAENG